MQQPRLKRLASIAVFMAVPAAVCAVAGVDAGQLGDGQAGYTPTEIAIALERTNCYGTCPVYNVTIDGLGGVTYEGHEHVASIGLRRATISREQVEELLNEFLRANFMQALDEYRTREFVTFENGRYRRMLEFVSDLPETILMLKLGPETKRVVLYHGFPGELGRLAERVDLAANTAQWTGSAQRPVPKRPGA